MKWSFLYVIGCWWCIGVTGVLIKAACHVSKRHDRLIRIPQHDHLWSLPEPWPHSCKMIVRVLSTLTREGMLYLLLYDLVTNVKEIYIHHVLDAS